MPVYTQSYRRYDGTFLRRFRWAVIMEQELRVLLKSRIFLVLLLFALIHVILRILQIVAYDRIVQDPNHYLAGVLRQFSMIMVNNRLFNDFLQMQSPLLFVVLLIAGSGMICNDFRNNLMEVYFSKPLSWRDYAFGKFAALSAVGFTITALPAAFFVLLHLMLAPGWDTWQESWPWLLASLGMATAMVVPCALGILASSSLIQSENLAGMAIVMLVIADQALALILANNLHNNNYSIVSVPVAVYALGSEMFDTSFGVDLHWGWSLGILLAVCLISAAIVIGRVRRAEVAA